MRPQEPVGRGFTLAQKPQQQVFGLDVRRAELAVFIAREKNDAPGFLRVAFKHIALPEPSGSSSPKALRPTPGPYTYYAIKRPRNQSPTKRFSRGGVTFGTP